MFQVEIKSDGSGQYFAEVSDPEAEIFYSTYKYPTHHQATEDARKWIHWFEKIRSGTVESIYYILAVPETWAGSPPGIHPYFGLQVKIGRTKNVLRRLQNLRTGTSGQLIIHALEPGGSDVERIRHKQFELDRRQGEWFACSPLLTKHILEIWGHYRVLPREHQYLVLELHERIKILRSVRKVFGGAPDMINPSLNEPWFGSVFIDLVHPRWVS
ncbi:GIY-YIG nuclease family protein [Nodularia spumigena CS-591/12]|uniref:GIY-YIG nuclease family protein n=1 Tax=Nodularia spumigena TaxID=70799 RepID=UPI00232DF26A|nr:GIY-YIG nuclease family protein [Nodularia spumigena]MDB9303996.1 GIY-YIG nuclease family protein [Nodularia spumigena CS-591/12]MDB9321434.1 GIY-YIG nuclease family protein [Nodularia spumigena CS-591/07A]MDB9330751.1 GIY-YIG nuclease family protein [Nodularia spumigena CS-591/04]